MANTPTFVLPAGVELEVNAATLSIRYAGDVQVEDTFGRRIEEIRAGGNVDLKLDRVQGTIVAGGTLTIRGDVDALVLHGKEVVLGRQRIKARAISADARITVGAASLAVDAIIAPHIDIDPKASGRVTVIECHNERGATKIKGGFSLADYDDMFGNAREFLAERGLAPLGPPGAATASAPAAPPVTPAKGATAPVPPVREVDKEIAVEPDDDDPAADDLEAAEAADGASDEDVDDPLSLSIDDIEPIMEQVEGDKSGENDLYEQLTDALDRITTCYEGTDLPPAVSELQLLVEQRDYDALRSNITEVWNGLLGFHQKRGIRPHHQVTHAFNVIHGLVQAS